MEFMRLTLFEGMMPHLKTLKRYIDAMPLSALREAGYTEARFDEVLPFYRSLGYTADAFLVINDATALLPAVRWRADDDALLGFALPDDALSRHNIRAGQFLFEVLEHKQRWALATQVELVMVCPLAPGYPAMAIGAFPQRAAPPAPGVRRRVELVSEALEQRGAVVLGYSADGASAQLSTMMDMWSSVRSCVAFASAHLPHLLASQRDNEEVLHLPGFPTLAGTTTWEFRTRRMRWKDTTLQLPWLAVSDPPHWINKVRNKVLNGLRIGDYDVTLGPLKDMMEGEAGLFAELDTMLRVSDLYPDRLDYRASQRLFSSALIARLQALKKPELQGASLFAFIAHSFP
jgi:hypothetical protein